MYCLCVNVYCHRLPTKCVLPPGVNQIAVDKYININIKRRKGNREHISAIKDCNGRLITD
jgi:hypothetical protein